MSTLEQFFPLKSYHRAKTNRPGSGNICTIGVALHKPLCPNVSLRFPDGFSRIGFIVLKVVTSTVRRLSLKLAFLTFSCLAQGYTPMTYLPF